MELTCQSLRGLLSICTPVGVFAARLHHRGRRPQANRGDRSTRGGALAFGLVLAVSLPCCTLGLDTDLVSPDNHSTDSSGGGDAAIDLDLGVPDASDASDSAEGGDTTAADADDTSPTDGTTADSGDGEADPDVPSDTDGDPISGCHAVARAQVVGTSEWATGGLEAAIFDEITLDGSMSVGDLSSYQWELTSRPSHSAADFTSEPQAVRTSFFLDDWGSYEFRLRVWDEDEEECPSARVVVGAVDESISIQLTWDTDQTDLDVHLLYPEGQWNREPLDCFWRNKSPDWGIEGDPYDDPQLTIDDTNGLGPEEILYAHPVGTPDAPVRYAVGVHVWGDQDHGPTDATVVLRFGTEVVAETLTENLVNREFVILGDLVWPDRTFERDGTRLPDIPNADETP